MSLFPAYSGAATTASTGDQPSTSAGPLFPSYATLPSTSSASAPEESQEVSTSSTTRYQSYQPEILEVWQEERRAPYEIVVSSDSAASDSSDGSVEILEERPRTDHKKKKKEKKEKKKKRKRKHKRHRESSEVTSRKRSGHRSRSRTPPPPAQPPPPDNSYLAYLPRNRANFLEDIPGLRAEDAYRLDRRSDPDNRGFNSLYERKVSMYNRREVIRGIKLVREFKNSKPPKKVKRYFKKKKARFDGSDGHFVAGRQILDGEVDYMPVPEDWNQIPEARADANRLRFRSMESSDFEVPTDSTTTSNRSQQFHDLTAAFNRATTNQAARQCIQMWVDFIRFQDLVLGAEDRKFAAEKKYAIIERALEANRRSVGLHLVRLKLSSAFYADLGSKVTDIDADWKRLCFLFPQIPELWFDYCRFSLRSQSVIAFKASSRSRKIFTSAFKSLSAKVLEGDFVSHEIDGGHLEKRLVDLVTMVARYLESVDQSEKAMGLWQAVVEFNLFTPSDLSIEGTTFEDWFSLFEQYWDTGLPRIGEFSPINWASFRRATLSGEMLQGTPAKDARNLAIFNVDQLLDQMENTILEEILKNNSGEDPKARIWLHYERLRHSVHWMPASSSLPVGASQEDIEDLERVVVSDEDLKPFLVRLRKMESKWYLVKRWLEWLGVPIVCWSLASAGSTSRWEVEEDPSTTPASQTPEEILFRSTTENVKLFETTLPHSDHGARFLPPSTAFVLQKFGLDQLLSGNLVSQGITMAEEVDHLSRADETVVKMKAAVVDNVFEALVNLEWPVEKSDWKKELILRWTRYKMTRCTAGLETVKSVRRFIKDFLRLDAYRNDLDLWFTYCSFEYAQSPEAGRKYFLNTLQLMLSQQGDPGISSSPLLLQFTLGFLRLELSLDQVTEHFLYHLNGSLAKVDSCIVCCGRNQESNEHALRWLVAVINGDPSGLEVDSKTAVSAVEVMRAMRKLESFQGHQVAAEHGKVLLMYLGKGGVTEASAHLTALTSSQPDAATRSHHLLHLQLHLHAYHIARSNNSRSIPPPTLTRSLIKSAQSIIRQALTSFPADPLFLALHITLSIAFNHFWFRLRRDLVTSSVVQFAEYLNKKYLELAEEDVHCPTETQESTWNHFMAALHGELLILDHLTETDQGTLNRIRHLFERALHYRDEEAATTSGEGGGSKSLEQRTTTTMTTLNDDWLFGKSLADCPTIWRLFLRFELKCSQGAGGRSRGTATSGAAKAILYRALQHCPNHKALYLDGINFCPELYEEFIDIMTDKQLRVRTTAEEVEMFVEAAAKKSATKT